MKEEDGEEANRPTCREEAHREDHLAGESHRVAASVHDGAARPGSEIAHNDKVATARSDLVRDAAWTSKASWRELTTSSRAVAHGRLRCAARGVGVRRRVHAMYGARGHISRSVTH